MLSNLPWVLLPIQELSLCWITAAFYRTCLLYVASVKSDIYCSHDSMIGWATTYLHRAIDNGETIL